MREIRELNRTKKYNLGLRRRGTPFPLLLELNFCLMCWLVSFPWSMSESQRDLGAL